MFENLRTIFEIGLTLAFLVSIVAYAIYRLTFAREYKAKLAANAENAAQQSKKQRKSLRHNLLAQTLNTPFRKTVYFFADLFWVLLLVVGIRSFLYEPFVIPSGSMKPGLQIRDIVVVNKYTKGLRMPISNTRLTQGEAIKRGDVLVFKFPGNPKIAYIKRVIGLPGDKIYYDNRNMIINGKAVNLTKIGGEHDDVKVQTPQGNIIDQDENFTVYNETLPPNATHTMRYANKFKANYLPREWVVPEGQYLMMGDNRDESKDGREFGLLDDDLIIGQAKRIAFNWGCLVGDGKCNRFFKVIQ